MKKSVVILFDFDGVLCHDHFYEPLLVKDVRVHTWIQDNIFLNKDKSMVFDWMKGRMSSQDVNRHIARQAGFDEEELCLLFEEGVWNMKIDQEMLSLARSLKDTGHKIGIVTDNMDIFSAITVPNYNLGKLFDIIINSADYGKLKNEEEGTLYEEALMAIGSSFEESFLIDDNVGSIKTFAKRGGQGFLYKQNIKELKASLEF